MSLTPPSTQEAPTADTLMPEAPAMEPTATTTRQSHTTADRVNQTQQQDEQPPPPTQQQQRQEQQHQQQHRYSAPERPPLVTDRPSASTFLREHPPRESTPRQTAPRLYDNTPSDRNSPRLSSYPTAPNSIPQTPSAGMSAPPGLRPHIGSPTHRLPHLLSYPTAPASASQTPQSGRSQTPQQGVSAAGWVEAQAAGPASRISFEGTSLRLIFPFSSFPFLYSCCVLL